MSSFTYLPNYSLPPAIAEMMTITTVLWEQALVTDINGQWTYAAPEEMNCWMEGEGYGSSAGVTISRASYTQNILSQTRRPELDLYFNGADPRAQSFTMNDRFTPVTTAGLGVRIQPTSIETMNGPPFDNQTPWLVIVGY